MYLILGMAFEINGKTSLAAFYLNSVLKSYVDLGHRKFASRHLRSITRLPLDNIASLHFNDSYKGGYCRIVAISELPYVIAVLFEKF